MTARLVAAIENLEALQSQAAALRDMATALAQGRRATLVVADHPGGIDVDITTANRVVNNKLAALDAQIEALETKLQDAESRL